jgi:osmotically-inducible protein OsmY
MNPRTLHLLPAGLILLVLLLQGCAAAVVGGAATGAAVVHDRRSAGVVLDDQAIELQFLQLVAERPEIAERSNISATSYNKSVLLTGQADNPQVKSAAGALAGSINEVRRVINEVQIGPDLSLGQKTQDSYVTGKVKAALFNVELSGFDPSRVKVVTHEGTVYLMGLLTEQEAHAAVQRVRMVSGVQKVVRAFEHVAS